MDLQRGMAALAGTSPTQSDLLDLAAQAGVEVILRPMPNGLLGAYDHDGRRILIDHRLTPIETRSVLAHELGHALLDHRGPSRADERAAERFAATLLINPVALERASRWARCDAELADELGITVDIVECYRACSQQERAA